jgi:hypothetical protein
VKSAGNSISGAQVSAYGFDLIAACRVSKGYDPVEDSGNARNSWPFDLVYDPTWGQIVQVATVGTLAAL